MKKLSILVIAFLTILISISELFAACNGSAISYIMCMKPEFRKQYYAKSTSPNLDCKNPGYWSNPSDIIKKLCNSGFYLQPSKGFVMVIDSFPGFGGGHVAIVTKFTQNPSNGTQNIYVTQSSFDINGKESTGFFTTPMNSRTIKSYTSSNGKTRTCNATILGYLKKP